MSKNLQLKQTRQLHFDKMMLLVGAVSLVGGLLVFRSYALQKPDTTKAGSVELRKLTDDNDSSYVIDIIKNTNYCFSRANDDATVRISGADPITLYNACFRLQRDVSGASVVTTGVDPTSQLLIAK